MDKATYLEKVYAGLLGKNIAVRLGAPLEPLSWTYERIQSMFPDINGYIKPVERFASDDDINGPFFFIRSIIDEPDPAIDASAIGRSWLNYARPGRGMFWWGGVGVSTEHTAYDNLARGIQAPMSGSIEQNGQAAAEQIGGQIFIDTWGLLYPNDPMKAAEMAGRAASVSHDGNGIYGARFVAACISTAFGGGSIHEIMATALNCIPPDSTYAKIIHSVQAFHQQYPDDFRACRDYLTAEWGYDRYPGACHIIPNSGVIALSLLYGNGDFDRTIEIATLCGWDTDCNAGNVGTILAVLNGLEGMSDKYRKPINDTALASSAFGFLNSIDIPSFARELTQYKAYIEGELTKDQVLESIQSMSYDFELSGSTHGVMTNGTNKLIVRHGKSLGTVGSNALQVIVDNLTIGDNASLFVKTNYHPEDLEDERYEPVFSPKVYPGQSVSIRFKYTSWEGTVVHLVPYIQSGKQEIDLIGQIAKDGQWLNHSFQLTNMPNGQIDKLGFKVISDDPFVDGNATLGELLIDFIAIEGDSEYLIDAAYQLEEFSSVTPFSHANTRAKLVESELYLSSAEWGMSLTGHYYTHNLNMITNLRSEDAQALSLIFRAKGLRDYYAVRFDGRNVELFEARTDTVLERKKVVLDISLVHSYEVNVSETSVQVGVDGENVLNYNALPLSYGAYGIGQLAGTAIMSRMAIHAKLRTFSA